MCRWSGWRGTQSLKKPARRATQRTCNPVGNVAAIRPTQAATILLIMTQRSCCRWRTAWSSRRASPILEWRQLPTSTTTLPAPGLTSPPWMFPRISWKFWARIVPILATSWTQIVPELATAVLAASCPMRTIIIMLVLTITASHPKAVWVPTTPTCSTTLGICATSRSSRSFIIRVATTTVLTQPWSSRMAA